jgi:malonyl-CoA O-methyltransferase
MEQIDKHCVCQSFSRGFASYATESAIQQASARQLIAKLPTRDFGRVFEFGIGNGFLTELIRQELTQKELILNDIVEKSRTVVGSSEKFIGGDIEAIELPTACDLIISNAVIQWLNEPFKMLEKVNKSLKPAGIFAFSTFGPQNFHELRYLTNKGLDYYSLATWESELKKRNFSVIYATEQVKPLEFVTPQAVLKHLRNCGVNGLSKTAWTKHQLQSFYERYIDAFSTTAEKVTLTYHPQLVIAQKNI